MYALPGQSPRDAVYDLNQALDLEPDHLSWYQLTIEPNTAFHHRPPRNLPADDAIWEITETGEELLHKAGYAQYEISAYAKPGHQCRHNLNYWHFGDYMGIGAGAHGKLSQQDGSFMRRRRKRHPADYTDAVITGDFLSGVTPLQDDDLVLEFMMNALRLNEGVPSEIFNERTGLTLNALASRLALLKERGILSESQDRIQSTAFGRRYLNEVLAVFA
jgi:oxygen-independent coproporphyrinogen-3 oxidase